MESTSRISQIIWLKNDNKSSIVVYFGPGLVNFSATDETSHEGPNPVSGKLQQPLSIS